MRKGKYLVIFIAVLLCISVFFTTKTSVDTVTETDVTETSVCVTKTNTSHEASSNIEVSVVSSNQSVISSSESKHEKDVSSEESSSEERKNYTSEPKKVPSAFGKFKSYTHYLLLSKSSSQWKKIQCNENAYTDNKGLRKVDEYYCVAMGSYYSRRLGDLFEIKTDGGSFKVIICDFKADRHTDSNHQYTVSNGCVVEFYVDTNVLDSTAKRMGDISYADKKFSGKIVSINKIGNYFDM